MILHEITVENWRSLRFPIRLAQLSPGINVIFGPNETGKSTIMDAVCRGLFDKHNTTGGTIDLYRPWGSALGPRVTLVFEQAGTRYRLEKQFLADANARLSVERPDGWEAIADRRNADEAVMELLGGTAPGRGLSKPEHWGLSQVLWVPQGTATAFDLGDGQRSRLQTALEVTLQSESGGAIEKAVRELYESAYTATGREKRGADAGRLREMMDAAIVEVDRLTARRAEVEQDIFNLEAMERENSEAASDLKQLAKDLDEAREAQQKAAEQLRQYERIEQAVKDRESEWRQVHNLVEQIERADALVTQAVDAAKQAQDDAPAKREARDHATLARAAAEREAHAAEQAYQQARQNREVAERRLAWAQLTTDTAERERLLALVTTHAKLVETLTSQLEKLVAPTAAQLTALRKLWQQIDTCRARVDAASLTVRIEPTRPMEVRAERDGQGSAAETIDGLWSFKAAGRAVVDITDVGRVTVLAGESDAVAIQEQLRAFEQDWKEKAGDFGGGDLAELEVRADQRKALESELKAAKANAPAGDATTLNKEIAGFRARRESLLKEDPDLVSQTETVTDAQSRLDDLRKEAKRAESVHDRARKALASADEIRVQAEAALTKAGAAIDKANVLIDERRLQAKTLRATDGLSDADRLAHRRKAIELLNQARQTLEATEKPAVETYRNRVTQLQAAMTRRQDSMHQQAERIGGLRNRVQTAGGQGLYTEWVRARETMESSREALIHAERKALAIAKLFKMIEDARRDALEQVTAPVRKLVSNMLRAVAGPRYDHVAFDEKLTPRAVLPQARTDEADLDQLSFGTREQVMLLVRLALARLIGEKGERQCLLLDDPLVNADRRRHSAMLDVLAAASQHAQLIVFTCHPQAYDALADVGRFDLEAMVAQAREQSRAGDTVSPSA